jgi:hypothetical protein
MAKNYNIPTPQFSVGGTRLPKWANGLIVVGSLAIVGAVGYYIYKKMNQKKEEEDSKAVVNATDNELKNEIKNGQKLNYPQSNYNSASNTIAQLLDGCEFYTSELRAIGEVIKVVKNKADWLNLCKTFGVKKIDNCGWMTGDTIYDLPTLLKDQLDTTTLAIPFFNEIEGYKVPSGWYKTRDILAKYLASKGITL